MGNLQISTGRKQSINIREKKKKSTFCFSSARYLYKEYYWNVSVEKNIVKNKRVFQEVS